MALEDNDNDSERARFREFAAYLSAASIGNDTYEGLSPSPSVSKDINLMALVQLAALRLDTDRSYLSLIDDEFQYIVAEATRQLPLLPNKVTEGEPPLFLGVCKLEKGSGACPNSVREFRQSDVGNFIKNGPNVICNRTRHVVNDFRTEPAYQEKPYVAGYPFMISFLEVPLISPSGHVLGSLCVVDNRKREFNNDKTVDTLTEMATAIIRHLDLVKIEAHHARSEKLMTGLGQIVDRDPRGTIVNSVSASETCSAKDTRRGSDVGSMIGTGIGSGTSSYGSIRLSSIGQNDLTPVAELGRRESNFSQSSQATIASSSETSSNGEYLSSSSLAWTPSMSPSQMEENEFFEPPSSTSEAVPNSSNEVAAEEIPVSPVSSTSSSLKQRRTPAPAFPPPSPSISTVTATSTHVSPVSSEVRDTLSKAAATIREAMDMDRVTFFDAVPSGFASRSAHPTLHEDQLSLDASEFLAEETRQVYCATLSESTKNSQLASSPALPMPEAIVQRLINRYPRGHIFKADNLGPIDSRYGPGHTMRNIQKAPDRTSRHRADIRKLFSLVPDAHYIVMLPLWHFQKEVWFSALFGIVEDPNFAIDLADINMLTALANSTMIQVSRCEALAVSKAKSDFISSISHELRSPLHGIMASGELLRDSIVDTQHRPLLDMIDSCSTTLLETFDNLLDFAKINTTKKAMNMYEHAFHPKLRADLPLIDLGGLVEETVELVQLGHYSRIGFHGEQESIVTSMAELLSNSGASTPGESLPDSSVLVTVNIEKRATWMTRIDTGAWKRIIMNLFGNSLKYTRSGHIEVSLSMLQEPGPSNLLARTHICFSVKDTGIGISPDYIKYHLYTPFSQENTLSPGTGLGLSIVQQLTKSLGGTMEVRSLLGIGTQVQVFVPQLIGENSGPLSLHLSPLVEESPMDANRDLAGHTLCCITLDAFRILSGLRAQTTSELRDRGRVMKSTLKQIAKDRLGMKVIFATKATELPIADIYFLDSNIYLAQGQTTHNKSKTRLPRCLSAATPMVMLCSGSGPLRSSRDEQASSRVVQLRQPLGPNKLATALIKALEIGKASPPLVTAPPILDTAVENVSYFPDPLNEKSALVKGQEISSGPAPPLSPLLLSTPMSLAPSLPETTRQSPSEPSTELHAPESGLHLLLVDDNPINLKILTTLAKKLNYTFAIACNGLEAVDLFNASFRSTRRPFNVIFMDMSMPVMDGFEATREIRKIEGENGLQVTSTADFAQQGEDHPVDPKANGCQIVALTGLGSESSRQEAFSSGINLFLTKPVKISEIKDVLSGIEERIRRGSVSAMPSPRAPGLRNSRWSFSTATSSTITKVSFRAVDSSGSGTSM